MDATSNRTRNIALLVARAGGPTAFGKLVDREQAQVSQWTSEKNPKPIGGALARYLESRIGLERGWMDREHVSSDVAPASHSQSMRLDHEMIRDVAKVLHEQFDKQGLVFSLKVDIETLIWMLEQRSEQADIRAPDNMVALGMKIVTRGSDERSTPVPAKGKAK